MDKSKIWVRIIAAILLVALVSSSLFALLYYLFM